MKAYLAAPIFTERDRNFNSYLEKEILKLCPDLDLYLAQNNASINDKTGCATSADIYVGDVTRLKEADLLITIMSGDLPPIGSSYETAYFCGLCENDPKRRIVALYDDSREAFHTFSEAKKDAMISGIAENQFPYINLLAIGYVKKWGQIYHTSAELIQAVKREYDIGVDNTISGIYKITNLKNNLIYIGQSVDIYTRWRAHKNSKENDALHTDIQKYGLNYFKFEILEKCSAELLDEREKYWIEYYDSFNVGYNNTTGGTSKEILTAQAIPVYCYNLDGKFIKKYPSGAAAAREIGSSFGTLWRTVNYNDSYHSCKNFLWRRDFQEEIEPYSEPIRSKGMIYAYDLQTRMFVRSFRSQAEAGQILTGKRQPHISDALTGKRKSCCGFLWANDYFERLPDDYYMRLKNE